MSKCIKCGNFYFSEPDTDDELCFQCEMEEKDEQIAELQKQLKETKVDLSFARNEINTLKNNLTISQEHKKNIEEQYLEKCKEIETKNLINSLYKTTMSLRDGDFKDLVYENNKLKQENQQLKEQNKKAYQEGLLQKQFDKDAEIMQLKQSQKQLAIRELEKVNKKIKEKIENITILLGPIKYEDYLELIGVRRGYKNSAEIIDSLIKELNEEECLKEYK